MKNFVKIILFLLISVATGCNQVEKDQAYQINPKADFFYQQSKLLMEKYFDKDSTLKAIHLLDNALAIDSLNPDYYGTKAKLLAEMGKLDSALILQKYADKINAINGEYLFQLGLFQAAKGFDNNAKNSFKRSSQNLKRVLKMYPDSLGAFILQQAANSLYYGEDSLYMNDLSEIRRKFPNRLMEIEMTRRLKPSKLITQLQKIERETIYSFDFDLDSLIEESVNKIMP